MPKIDIVNAKNIIESNPEKAFFKLKNTGGPKGDTGAQGPQGPKGDQGEPGAPGASASVTVGSTTTLSPGADATVTNSGDTRNAILNFGIPTGAQGPQGIQGPKGDTGPMGQTGAKGDTGAAATVQVGNTNTGAPGTNAQVTNAGNEHFAVFNFTIPRGDKGEKGATGAQGAKGDTGEQGPQGIQGPKGDTGSVKSDVVAELPETGEEDTFYLVNREATEQTATGKAINFTNNDNAGDITDFKLDGETSQNGTPTPDAPVPVKVVTGENVVKICEKNLFDKNAATQYRYISDSNGSITYSSNNYTYAGESYIPCEPNTAYTLSGGSQYMRIAEYTSDKTFIKIVNSQTSSSPITITTGNTGAFLRVSYNDTSLGDAGIQLELGSTATAYEPYQGQSYTIDLGSIELCKIGDYQDSIYKSGDKWYVHKETAKVVLNGTENWGNGGVANTQYTDSITNYAVSENSPFSSSFSGVSNVAGAGAVPGDNTIAFINRNDVYRFYIKSSVASSVDSVKTWLSNNNLPVYYALATPTDTEITNEALITQLDNVASAPLYTGVNNITTITPNEQGTLEIKYVTYDKYNQNKVYIWNDTLQQWQIIVP